MSPHPSARQQQPLPHRARRLAVAVVAAALAVPAVGAVPGTADPEERAWRDKVSGQVLGEVTDGSSTDFWIHFGDRPDLTGTEQIEDWDARGIAVWEALTATALASQAGVRAELDAAGVNYEAFTISNAIKVTGGDRSVVQAAAADPGVDGVYPTFEVLAPDPESEPAPAASPTPDAVEWGIADIHADDVWAQGVTGQAIVVASIDTGVQFDHPALIDHYRGNRGGGVFDHDYNWHDVNSSPHPSPRDRESHGTHVTGTIVGDDGGTNRIGVAPGATWIVANGCCPSDAALVRSMEWMLAPTKRDGSHPDPSRRPHIVNNSWGTTQPSTSPIGEDASAAWAAAGIFGVFAGGNAHTPGNCSTVSAPGSRTINYAVGNYRSNHTIAADSGRGAGQGGTVKPDIAAPGSAVRSAVPENAYALKSGTSMAAPHAAGAVALLWSAKPSLLGDIPATRAALNTSAINTSDLSCGGTAGRNNVFGEGRLDVLAAFTAAADQTVIRLSGVDRYATAAAVSGDTAPGVDTVYVATGATFPDALTVAAAGGAQDAPVLLTRQASVPPATAGELARLDPDRVVVVGGSTAVAPEVLSTIAAVTGAPVSRVSGTNRYGTAAAIAGLFPASDTVFVAVGTDYPDALAGSAAAGTEGAPVLLTRHDALPPETRAALTEIDPATIVLLGGESAVSREVAEDLAGYGTVSRVRGADRYETAARVADRISDPDEAYVASGRNWPDAIAGAARAGSRDAPVLLTRPGALPGPTRDTVQHVVPLDAVYVLGGTAAVGETVRRELGALR